MSLREVMMETPRVRRPVSRRVRQGIAAVIVAGAGFSIFTFFGGSAQTPPADSAQAVRDSGDAAQAGGDSAQAPVSPIEALAQATADTSTAAGETTGDSTTKASAVKYNAGEDPDFAARMGWPVKGPPAKPGAILPNKRIVAFYGNPLSKKMGVLGEYETQEMLRKLDGEVAKWTKADPSTPAIPALHLIVTVAQGDPGPTGKYRLRHRDALIEQVAQWADSRHALLFLDVQVGLGTVQEELPRLIPFLKRPNVHLGIDPEFSIKDGTKTGKKIGTMNSKDINFAVNLLAKVAEENNLPPKILIVHRFTRNMVTDAKNIRLNPNVQIVMNMDGWGAPWLKRDSYRDYIVREPVQYTGFKLFYHNDTKKGNPLMSPAEVLKLRPQPLYIQYQ
jgi:hypothetical protein